jgi:hypothetical protein
MAELKKIIDSKDENISASDYLLSFLLDYPTEVDKAIIDKYAARGLDEERAYARAITNILAPNDKETSALIIRHLNHHCAKLANKKYAADPYYQNISFPNCSFGKWEIVRDIYRPYEAFAFRDIKISNLDFSEITQFGFFDKEFSFPAIEEDGRVWMSITPHEIETMREAIDAVSGTVVVMGLGLGYFPYMIARKSAVKRIIIVEKDAEVIGLFNEHLLHQFPNFDKIEIIEEDAFDYAREKLGDAKADYAFVDLWRSVDDGLELFAKMKAYEKKAPATKFIYWIEDSLLAMIRRIIITIFQEALEGFASENYERADRDQDRIFNELYHKMEHQTFTTIEQIRAFLSRGSLSVLLSK